MAPDEMFVGYTPQYSMAVWTGYKNRMTPIYGNGLNVAADVYKAMQSYLNEKYGSGSEDFEVPKGVYTSGGYAYLSGSSNYTYSPSSSSVYSNIYGSSSSSNSSEEASSSQSSSEDTSSTEASSESSESTDTNSSTEGNE